jgi:hypothetical protein
MCENMVPPDPLAVVMGIEETFGLTIPDEEAEQIRTMGQLEDYVRARVVRGQEQVCVTSAAFYRLRRALGEVCGVPRERVRPQARLEDLVPLPDRPRAWHELQARLGGLHLPPLRRPAWLARRLEALSLVPLYLMAVGTIVLTALFSHTPAGPLVATFGVIGCPVVGIAGMFLVCRVACRRTQQYAVHLPPTCATVRDLVYALVSGPSALRLVSDTTRASDKEIWGTLCAIVGGELDRPPDSFTRATFL